jgi:MFS family permease
LKVEDARPSTDSRVAPQETVPAKGPSYVGLLRNHSFAALWVGQLVSQSGDAIFDVALLWLVFVTTNSTPMVGLTQAAVTVPAVATLPIAGVYADRLNRRNVMIAGNLFQGAITGVLSVLYLANYLTFPPLLLLVLLLYAGAQFVRAANGAIIPSIVSRENLGAANGLFSLTTSANQLASYAVGGIAILAIGYTASIAYDSFTFFFAAVMLTFVAKSYGEARSKTPGPDTGTGGGFLNDFREGLAYVRKSRLFLELIALGILVNFFGAGVTTLLAPFVKVRLGGDALSYGLALSSFSLGLMAGAVVVGKLNFRRYIGKLLIFSLTATGLLIAVAGLAQTVPEGLVAFVAIGALSGVVNIPIAVMVQTQVPREVLGRATTVMGSFLSAVLPVSALTFGWLGGQVSLGTLFEVSGLAVAAVSVVLYFPFVELRNAKY